MRERENSREIEREAGKREGGIRRNIPKQRQGQTYSFVDNMGNS